MAMIFEKTLRRKLSDVRYWTRRTTRPRVVEIDGVRLEVDYANWSALMVDEFLRGTYEIDERRMLRGRLSGADRVLEVGSGVGLIALVCSQTVPDANLLLFEANPALIDIAKRNFKINGKDIRIENTVLTPKSFDGSEIDFHVHENFWSSSLARKEGTVETIKVKTRVFDDVVGEFAPTVLIMDIEGGEYHLLANADETSFASIRKIVIEMHYRYAGRENIDSLVKRFYDMGFAIDLEHSLREQLLLTKVHQESV